MAKGRVTYRKDAGQLKRREISRLNKFINYDG